MMDYGGAYSLDDPHLVALIQETVADNRVNMIVETGTNVGKSTAILCRMAPRVVSIDVDPDCTRTAEAHLAALGITNCTLVTDHSEVYLRHMAELNLLSSRTLFFIDAHMQPDTQWPLHEEIAALPRGRGILLFHDIKVPDRDFAFSQFVHPDGAMRDFTYESIREVLSAWSPTHSCAYNREASGSRVGAMVVYP